MQNLKFGCGWSHICTHTISMLYFIFIIYNCGVYLGYVYSEYEYRVGEEKYWGL